MHKLSMGANALLTMPHFEVAIEWPGDVGALDCSAYLLTASGKVRGDADMIFYNQPSDATGAVRITLLEPGRTHLRFDLSTIPVGIERVVVCATIEGAGRTMSAFAGTSVVVRANGEATLGFIPDLRDASEVAMRLIEVYRRNGAWKLRADGQGFNDGLAPLARSFGIDVADDEASPTKSEPVPAARAAAVRVPAVAVPVVAVRSETPPTPPVADDRTIRLDATRPSHIWPFASGDHPGQVSAILRWSSPAGGLNGRPRTLELALGCLYELTDGSRGAVQAWDSNGAYDRAPWLELVSVGAGLSNERKLVLNGEYLHLIRRLALYAFIPFEAPNWKGAVVELELAAAGHKPVSVAVNYARDGFGLLGLVNLSGEGGLGLAWSGQAYLGHQDLDRDLGWDLAWRTASSPG